MRVLVLVFLVACAEAPSTGEFFTCDTLVTCVSGGYLVHSSGCAENEEMAEAVVTGEVTELVQELGCEIAKLYVTCGSTEEVCIY